MCVCIYVRMYMIVVYRANCCLGYGSWLLYLIQRWPLIAYYLHNFMHTFNFYYTTNIHVSYKKVPYMYLANMVTAIKIKKAVKICYYLLPIVFNQYF